MSLSLHEVLKNSYADRKKQQKDLKKYGYDFDSMLSNGNQQVYYNPNDKKLLFSVTGTHNLSDWGTDAYLLAGKLKDTNRYKEADQRLKEAKQKYNVDNATVVGHSLGGTIGGYIASKGDDVYTLDKGATFGQPVKQNENAFRTSGDVVSILDANATHMKTLDNPNISTGILPVDILNAHFKDNIKDANIFLD
jgi:hypothetical protein